MKRILFYGASNVYGFDPRMNSDGRYPVENIWTSILAEEMPDEWKICADGMNGRRIPDMKYDRASLERSFERHGPFDVFAFMLGTNDILASADVDVKRVLEKMEAFVSWLKEEQAFELLMIAPVWVGADTITDPLYVRFRDKCKEMNRGLKLIADKYAIGFADAQDFGIELCFDHVHFTQKGHRRFAERMAEKLLEY